MPFSIPMSENIGSMMNFVAGSLTAAAMIIEIAAISMKRSICMPTTERLLKPIAFMSAISDLSFDMNDLSSSTLTMMIMIRVTAMVRFFALIIASEAFVQSATYSASLNAVFVL